MRVLHTADWHLGKKLEQCERTEEHQFFLDWLIDELTHNCIEVLIIAGDIFDTGNPSNVALEQYYKFLWRVKGTCCREVIIIGGNHDSISTLNAPKELLKFFNIHVVGGVPEDIKHQIIPVKNAGGKVELVVCAIPFLRDRDVRLSVAGETAADRESRIKEGICAHYNRFKTEIASYKEEGIPVIATGHLFAAGSSTSESEKEIHVGNLGQICGDQFPEEFNYVALGHIHRPQIVNKMSHVRYSGSPIPLSFSETDDEKQVLILKFGGGGLQEIRELKVPCCRKLIRLKGTLEEIRLKLGTMEDKGLKMPAWVELQISTDRFIHDLDEQLEKLKEGKPFIERFFPRQIKTRASMSLNEQSILESALHELEPRAVFLKRCESELPEEDHGELLQLFDEILEKMAQRD
ncbi:exodeoxyribonuclease I subunit D [Arcticibacter pallidicorallinus]|uniref:Nuclease SbcCD subunit D n=1 Tax=Arcticibacter pallidicorallinus TaxID=1259464 RepID=A0A2T0U5P4_9SPHI|nr:exonuclease SbcCD subunit D C-terminal domain-containing protein [Arcticibacter pallidicorallinus]PRY53220.1 exodeoxyribonuclease I subunit D [Arcticibacter pallidicorallinus]